MQQQMIHHNVRPRSLRPLTRGRFALPRDASVDVPANRQTGPARDLAARRGVLLLVVLSLLVLFSLIAVTFMLLAGRYLDTTRSAVKAEQTGDNPSRLLDEVLGQCIRGTTNPNSVIRSHSLLEDLYGNDGIKYTGTGLTFAPLGGTNPQLIGTTLPAGVNFTFTAFPGVQVPATYTANYPLSTPQLQLPGYFNGCVLTALDGAAKGKSTRIVGWGYNTGTYTVNVLAFEGVTLANLTSNPIKSFVINGRPFNGTGFGLNPNATLATAQTLLDASETNGTVSIPFALLPNPVFADPNHLPTGYSVSTPYPQFGGIGGADEDYDAPDAQNMLLAHMMLDPMTGGGVPLIMPSLHRPDTLAYLSAHTTIGPVFATPAVKRQAQLRPLDADHPQFPPLLQNNQYDVDNDGDGVTDSIWVDAGLPVRTAPDGRTYKPMVAILCLDMDGRLNVNAHGNVVQTQANYHAPIAAAGGYPMLAQYLFSAAGTPADIMPRGLGYGPAEVNLQWLFANPTTDYIRLLGGGTVGGLQLEGRYGEIGATSAPYNFPLPGVTLAATTTRPDDVLVALKRYGTPANNYFSGVLSSYGSPSDLWGRSAVGLDFAGQPIYSYVGFSGEPSGELASSGRPPEREMPNDPYTVNLLRDRAASQTQPSLNDNLFTVAELERVLRKFDADSPQLPDRLRALLDPAVSNTNPLQLLVTTDSNDLPVPSTVATRDMAQVMGAARGSMTILDLLQVRMQQRATLEGYGATTAQIEGWVSSLVTPLAAPPYMRVISPQIVAGHRFDLNRPFGNGEDDNGNGVVDEAFQQLPPHEYTTSKEVPSGWSAILGSGNVPPFMDLYPDSIDNGQDEGLFARQEFAQQLYVLMMTLVDPTAIWAQDGGADVSPVLQRELTARQIAQWAINVVDFRDPDSIMTPFEYDVNPFNGWTVDGDYRTDEGAGTERRIVWGVESPELLLTETLATHNRRVQDLANDNGSNNDRNNSKGQAGPDPTLDQANVPQGSVFFELLSTRLPNATKAGLRQAFPPELYDASNNLDLGRMAPPGGGATYPVWRIAITGSRAAAANYLLNRVSPGQHENTTSFDPFSSGSGMDNGKLSIFNSANTFGGQVGIERIVWFTNQSPAGTDLANVTYHNAGGMSTLLSPGHYALIGPRPNTYFGKKTDGSLAHQSINLVPGNVEITGSNGVGVFSTTGRQQPLPIVCSSPALPAGWLATHTPAPHGIGVSVTEPLYSGGSYYPAPATGYPDLSYTLAHDNPFDSYLATTPLFNDKLGGLTGILSSGTTPNYKTALLQRLANPLAPYDATLNPYITVDWQPIDLVVFNGERLNGSMPNPFDPDDQIIPNAPPATLSTLVNHERGSGVPSDVNPWSILNRNQLPKAPDPVPVQNSGSTDVFPYTVPHSLGFLNPSIGKQWATPPSAVYANLPDPAQATFPFPSMSWNNRPYISEAELLLVPAGSAEQILRKFTTRNAELATSPYNFVPGANQLPYGHLLNFLMNGTGAQGSAPNYARILDYVHVPTPFVGAETFLNPSTTYAVSGFFAPFNRISNYREPGRVNINTIPGTSGGISQVWNGVIDKTTLGTAIRPDQPSWAKILASRNPSGNILATTTHPSYFANPFRSAAGAAYSLPIPTPTPPAPDEVDATFLRPQTVGAVNGLFKAEFGLASTYAHSERDAYFYYQPLLRMRNRLTTRSNVYAIWITVGYFEVMQAPTAGPGTAYPDGYQLMGEMGSDTGEVERHRAFYIYDRSIPVGFEPGKDHNYADGLLLRRYIE